MPLTLCVRNCFILILACFGSASAAVAQTAETVDPTTGNYVPGKDPFNATPKADNNNPNRLRNRLSKRMGEPAGNLPATGNAKTAPAQPAQQDTSPASQALQYPSWWPK